MKRRTLLSKVAGTIVVASGCARKSSPGENPTNPGDPMVGYESDIDGQTPESDTPTSTGTPESASAADERGGYEARITGFRDVPNDAPFTVDVNPLRVRADTDQPVEFRFTLTHTADEEKTYRFFAPAPLNLPLQSTPESAGVMLVSPGYGTPKESCWEHDTGTTRTPDERDDVTQFRGTKGRSISNRAELWSDYREGGCVRATEYEFEYEFVQSFDSENQIWKYSFNLVIGITPVDDRE